MSNFGKCGGGGRRRAARENVPLVVVFTTFGAAHTAELVDISTTGARLHGDHIPGEGDEIALSAETLRAFGTVAWVCADEFGISFDEPLADEDVQTLRSKVGRHFGLDPSTRLALDLWNAGAMY